MFFLLLPLYMNDQFNLILHVYLFMLFMLFVLFMLFMLFTLFMLSSKLREKRVFQILMPIIWFGWMVFSQLHEIKISQGKGKKVCF